MSLFSCVAQSVRESGLCQKCFLLSTDGGVTITFPRSRQEGDVERVRRATQAAGFFVEDGPGPALKVSEPQLRLDFEEPRQARILPFRRRAAA